MPNFKVKFLLLFFFSVYLSTLPLYPGENHNLNGTLPSITRESTATIKLDQLISHIQKELKIQFGIEKIFIGGGSSRAILDHFYFNTPLKMRDLDIMVVANRLVDEDWAKTIGEKLESPLVGKFSKMDLRPRPRTNRELPVPRRYFYIAGHGLFWKKGSQIVDLSLFHSQKDLQRNGILNVDKILIELESSQSLKTFLEKIKGVPYAKLAQRGLIIDPYNGYKAWVEKKIPQIIHLGDVISKPAQISIRIIRALGKLGIKKLSPELKSTLESNILRQHETDRFQLVRNLLKLLGDENAGVELKLLAQIKMLQKISPSLQLLIEKIPLEKLQQHYFHHHNQSKERGPPDSRKIFLKLLKEIPLMEKVVIYHEMKKIGGGEASQREVLDLKIFYKKTFKSKRLIKYVHKSYLNSNLPVSLAQEVGRIDFGRTLNNAQKKELLIRALVRRLPISDQKKVLKILRPEAKNLEYLRKFYLKKRLAFFTGVFNPIHLGHVDVVKDAINQMVLDHLFVIPTPATTHNEKPIPWDLRLKMADLELKDVPEASVVTKELEKALLTNTGEGLKSLMEIYGKEHKWIQILGADSFARFIERGFIEKVPEGRDIYVVTREGYEMPKISPSWKNFVFVYQNEPNPYQFTEHKRSSTVIRNLRLAEKEISGLVTREVELFILENNLYSANCLHNLKTL